MSYRTILVHLQSKDTSDRLLSLAVDLALQHNAHLIAAYVVPSPQFYVSSELPIPTEVIERHEIHHKKISRELKEEFELATATHEFVSEWREIREEGLSMASTIVDMARTVDLVLMAQRATNDEIKTHPNLPEDVVLACARPVIVVPKSAAEHRFNNVFIAWDGREQAVRAVFDSLPILREADSVRIHTINAKGRGKYRILNNPGELANTLSRHGVNVSISESDSLNGEVGEEILQYANDIGSDMLVMGAYGHTRIREYVFGGVTRKVLAEMPIPVLMSH